MQERRTLSDAFRDLAVKWIDSLDEEEVNALVAFLSSPKGGETPDPAKPSSTDGGRVEDDIPPASLPVEEKKA